MATGTVMPVNRIVDKTYWDRYADAETAIPEFPDHLNATYSAQDRWLNACHGTRRCTSRRRMLLGRPRCCSRGADANAKNNKGLTPLDIAAVFNVSATAEVLRRCGTRR